MANVPFVALDNGGIMLPISLDMTLVSSRDDHYRSQRSVAPGPYHLLALPSEILLMILGFLDIADILRLRETCKQLRALASPWQVRAILGRGRLHSQLLRVCKTCLRYDPSRSRLLDSSPADPGYPLASCCLECAVKAGDPRIRMGKGIVMANLNVAWICRWCGRFTIGDGALKCEQIHHDCYSRIMSVYLALGWIQFGLGIVAAALAWKYYRHEPSVFISTVTNFILFWICLAVVGLRRIVKVSYGWTLALELCIMLLWISPICRVAIELATARGGSAPSSAYASLVLFGLNM